MCKKEKIALFFLIAIMLVACSSPTKIWIKRYNKQLLRDYSAWNSINRPLDSLADGLTYIIDTVSLVNPVVIKEFGNYYLVDGYASQVIDKNSLIKKKVLVYNNMLWQELDNISKFYPYSEKLQMPLHTKLIPDSVFCKGRISSYTFEKKPVFMIVLENAAYSNVKNSCVDCDWAPIVFCEDAIHKYVKVAYPLFPKDDQ